MTACKKHSESPVKGYNQCAGCEIEALRAENGQLRAGMVGDYDLDAWLDWTQEAKQLRGELEAPRSQLEAARGLLRDIFCTCNLREMPSEHAIRDISNQIEALLTATQAPEVRNTEQDDDEARHDAVKEIHDVMAAVPCSSLYSLAEAVLDAGYVKSAEQGERQEAVPEIVCRRLLFAFGLECNSIGLLGAAENLHKGMKEAAAAHRQAQQGGSHDT